MTQSRRVHRLLRWLIDDCSPEIAACESDCRKTSCTQDHWEQCELRLAVAEALQPESITT